MICKHFHQRMKEHLAGIGVASLLLTALGGMSGCPATPPAAPPAGLPLIVGMEYATAGIADELADIRTPGVKPLPDLFGWDKMQPTANSSISFTVLDRLVVEYQRAGYTDLMLGLKSKSSWASVDPNGLPPNANYAPKPEHMADYTAWVQAVVERYDDDGIDDMPGLRRAIRYYEIGVEFSSYEPESAADYLGMLTAGYQAAHAAYSDVIVLNSAFLTTNAFMNDPTTAEYPLAFAAVDKRIMYHSLADIRTILDHPELFDAANLHILGVAEEIEPTVRWVRYEMQHRGYDKSVVISDTAPSPLIAWGPATTCDPGSIIGRGIIIPPARQDDRCRLADFFNSLIAGDATALAWARAYAAVDMSRKVIIAAEQEVEFINTSFMSDLELGQTGLFNAGAGLSAWGGMTRTTLNAITQRYTVAKRYPLFYALRQLCGRLDGYGEVRHIVANDASIRLYRIAGTDPSLQTPFWIAWQEPPSLLLPGDTVPTVTLQLDCGCSTAHVEDLITVEAQTTPTTRDISPSGGVAEIPLTWIPVFILPS